MRAVVVLPTPRGPAKTNRLRDAIARDRVPQRLGDAALAHHVIETLGTPPAGDDLICHGY